MVAGLDAFFATKPSNTFSEAFEKVLEGFVKSGAKPSKIKINRKIFGFTVIIVYLCTKHI